MVEAGTGVGKSFAYLIPAIKRIVENGERVRVRLHEGELHTVVRAGGRSADPGPLFRAQGEES